MTPPCVDLPRQLARANASDLKAGTDGESTSMAQMETAKLMNFLMAMARRTKLEETTVVRKLGLTVQESLREQTTKNAEYG